MTARAYGLEAQKTLANEIKAKCGRSQLSTIAHYASQRNEPSTVALRFISRMKSLIGQSPLSNSAKDHYLYHLIGSVPEDSDKLQQLLLHESTSSLIDAYEAFVAGVLACAAASDGSIPHELMETLHAQEFLQDPRVAKVKFLLGADGDDLLKTRCLERDHALLAGKYESPADLPASEAVDFRRILIEAMHRVALGAVSEMPNTIPSESLLDVSVALSDLGRAQEAFDSLKKSSLNPDGMAIASSLVEVVDDLLKNGAPFSPRNHFRSLVASPYLDPWDLPFLPAGVRAQYLNALVGRYGNSPAVQFAAWICGFSENCSGLCPTWELFGGAWRSFIGKQYPEAVSLASKLEGSLLFRAYAVRWRCHSLIELGLVREAIRYSAEQLSASAELYPILPVDRLIGRKDWKDLSTYSDEIGLAVLLDFYWRRTGISEINSFRRYAAEDFLSSINIERPSDIAQIDHGIPSAVLIYFLSNVCSADVIDLMTAFSSSKNVQEERRNIYALLAQYDPKNDKIYRDGMTRVTKVLMLDEGVRFFDQSRLFVEEQGVVRWAESELRESFDRYRSLYEAGVGSDSEEFAAAVRKFLEDGKPLPDHFLKPPKGEADELLLHLISKIRDDFLLSPTHGLDAYLSVRVRHGTLSGMLRGPLEQSRIINQRKSGSLKYQRNDYWERNLTGMSSDQLTAIDNAINLFSESYDSAIENLKARLQVRGKSHPGGMFDIPLNSFHVYLLRTELASDVRVDEFVSSCIDLFWILLDQSLSEVRKLISNDFRSTIEELFRELEMELQQATYGTRCQPLTDSVRLASTEVQGVLVSIETWFQRGPGSKLSYSIRQAVEIAVEVVRITYRSFDPEITTIVPDDDLVLIDSVTTIGDIVFTTLDNVYKHSGLETGAIVTIEVEVQESKKIVLAVENTVGADFDRNTAARQICRVRDRMQQSEQQTAAASTEGGTGLMKLKNLVDADGKRDDALRFWFTRKGNFRVEVEIDTYGLDGDHLAS